MKRSTLPNKKNQEIFPQGECSFHHEQIIESTPFNKKKKTCTAEHHDSPDMIFFPHLTNLSNK
jgi:hypothetical protein